MNTVTLPSNIRDQKSFAYSFNIIKPFGALEFVLSWCKQELAHEWRWCIVDCSSDINPGMYTFYFDCDRDYITFIMKWK